VTLDMEGFRSGSMDEVLLKKEFLIKTILLIFLEGNVKDG